jgi:hypothetical protein
MTSQLKGLFALQSKKDLLKKLEHDFARLKNNPLDQYAAFDFFVTAYHLLDWVYPDSESGQNTDRRKDIESTNALLRVCSHLANGAKHFVAMARKHDSVQDAVVQKGAFQADAFDPEAFQTDKLTIQLQGAEATELGCEFIECVRLASKILKYWQGELASDSLPKG